MLHRLIEESQVKGIFPVWDDNLTPQAIVDSLGCGGLNNPPIQTDITNILEFSGVDDFGSRVFCAWVVQISTDQRWLGEAEVSLRLKAIGLRLATTREFLCFCSQYAASKDIMISLEIITGSEVGIGTFVALKGSDKRDQSMTFTGRSPNVKQLISAKGDLLYVRNFVAVPI